MRLIDAEHLERWLEQVLSNANPLDRKARNAFSECLAKLKSMPTIEAEPVRHDGCEFCKTFDFSEARCTVEHGFAHISLAVGSTRFPIHERFNFCPNCGAKMDAKEETT